ncbi:MAG: imidazole glycerol phosphate synthase subunit HisH [Clostridia bacterium]|nr:imidazole glycerol phosphate synthase subunit HisH [Clostridia bacterium]
MVTIIDYNAGNLASVYNALQFIGCDCRISNNPDDIIASDAVILPGVGAYAHAVDSIDRLGLRKPVLDFINSGKPFLGICLGLQLLFEGSFESPGAKGLGIFNGTIKKIPKLSDFKVPHMGWNSLSFNKDCYLFDNINNNPYVYFVHSFYLDSPDKSIVSSQSDYSVTIDASVYKDNICATQFHPEKSGDLGIQMLKNFSIYITKG